MNLCLLAACAAAMLAPLVRAQTWDTGPWDRRDGRTSEEPGHVHRASSRAADDFALPEGNGRTHRIVAIRAEMLAIDYEDFFFEIYADLDGWPAPAPMMLIEAAQLEVLESRVFGLYDRVRFSADPTEASLPAGRYWLAAVCRIDTDGQSYFCTAGRGLVLAQEGVFHTGDKSWQPSRQAFGYPTDFAFRVDSSQCEADCDGDGLCDDEEIATGVPDCDADGRPDECQPDRCPADLAVPRGILNIFDLLVFQDAFGEDSPCADIAEPFGLLDVMDVLSFFDLYAEGCG